MRLGWRQWGGICPKVSPRNLPETIGQTAQNIWLAEQDMQPIKEPLDVQAIPAGQISIYLWRRGGSTEWLYWSDDVNVVRGPIADDQYARIYYTDGTTLHMKLWDSATSAKVEVSDVSIAPPAAPTITKSQLFKAGSVRAYWGPSAGIGSITLQPLGFTQDGNIFKIKFKHVPVTATEFHQPWLYFLVIDDNQISNVLVPKSGHTAQNDLYTDITDIKDPVTPAKRATFQVVSMDSVPIAEGLVVGNTTYWGNNITFNCVIDAGRSSTQYQYYVQTTINAYGQESPPSPVSEMVTWSPLDILTIKATSNGRLYRSATGTVDSDFFFLAENPGSTYQDWLVDASLAEKIPLIENPPSAMTGLVSMPGGFLAAFNGKDVYFSEPWLPYSWPTRYRLTMDYDVVGLGVCGNDLIVLTTGYPYYVAGTHPEILTVTKLGVEQSCVSKRSIAYSGNFLCYASPDGLMAISGGSAQVVTAKFYTRDQWQALNPQDMIGAVHDGRYIGWLTAGAIIVDFKEPNSTLSTTDETATGLYSDLENDQLFLIQGTEITDWRAGANNLLATWKSKQFQNVQDAIFNSAKLIADTYVNTTFKMYSNGVLVWTYVVPDVTGFRVPKFDRSGLWEVQVETTDRVVEVILASSMTLLRSMEGIKNP